MQTDKLSKKRILITGAAGNLGNLLAQYLQDKPLNLLIHKKDVEQNLKDKNNIRIFKADLALPETLFPALQDVDTVVHFAGVLFKANPEKFLPTTNTDYLNNLLDIGIN